MSDTELAEGANVFKRSEEKQAARERRDKEKVEDKERKRSAKRAKQVQALAEAGVLTEAEASAFADDALTKKYVEHLQRQTSQRMADLKQRSSLRSLGIIVKSDGNVLDATRGRRLGPLAGARAEVTNPARHHRAGAAVTASIITMGSGLGPTGVLAALSKKSVAMAVVVFPDGTTHQHRLDGAWAIERAEVATITFNAMAQAAAGQYANASREDSQTGAFVADEIRKLADLHASGVITDDEFAAKKKQLLDL